jgi:SSS family solute:Na+ symporter
MPGETRFPLELTDYAAFAGFFAVLSAIGYLAGRKERSSAQEYFLAGKKLPWYVIGGSFIASNISTEHFIGMVGAAVVYGICVALSEWLNVFTFSLLIWIFIPFLLASRVFTIPEFLERRFSPGLRLMFAIVTIVSNVVAFLAAVLYGGALALEELFGWDFWPALIGLGFVAGIWAIYGGLSSVAWTDLFTVVVMVLGGICVTVFGLEKLAGDDGTLADGLATMLRRNQASEGLWQQAVSQNAQDLAAADTYNRLSVVQPASHPTHPWVSLVLTILSVSIWYNVLNQFMIQRVLGARSAYHARMGIVLAGFMKLILPAVVVLPGLILFALRPEILLAPWSDVRPAADQGYVTMVQSLVPAGLRGLFLAALFGAIQSTVNSVLNSTATVFTMDIYKRWLHPDAGDKLIVVIGIVSSSVVLVIAIGLGGFIGRLGGSLFEYIQSLYAFFAPPFAAVFLLGILSKRISAAGAMATVIAGFLFGIGVKVYLQVVPGHPAWMDPYANQAAVNWLLSAAVCIAVSLITEPPRPEQVTDQVTINWRRLNVLDDLGRRWYSSVVTWWILFVVSVVAVMLFFSGLCFPTPR